MKIILMRHGKPVLAPTDRITPAEMERWIEHYNLSEVEADSAPIAGLQRLDSTICIVSSTAPRALSSGLYRVRCRRRVLRGATAFCSLALSSFVAFRLGGILPPVLVLWLLERFRVSPGD